MSRNVNDIIRTLKPAQRKKVAARAAELIAEEMALAGTPPRAETHAGKRGKGPAEAGPAAKPTRRKHARV